MGKLHAPKTELLQNSVKDFNLQESREKENEHEKNDLICLWQYCRGKKRWRNGGNWKINKYNTADIFIV